MKLRSYVAALAAVGLGLFCAATASAHTPNRLPDYGSRIVSGNLAHGGRYMLIPESSIPLTAVELWYAVPSIGYGSAPSSSIARLAAQAVAASAPVNGSSLGDFVAAVGGTLSIDAFPDSVAITAVVPSSDADATVKTMTHSYFSALVTDAGLRRAKLDLATQAILDKFDAETVIRNGLMSALFTAGPEHYPTLEMHDLNGLTAGAVRSFAEQGFQSQRASLVVTGAANPRLIDAIQAGPAASAASVSDGAEALVSEQAKAPTDVSLKFNEPGNGFAWIGPDISDETAATAMDFIADYLFHPVDGTMTRFLAATAPDVSLTGQFITLRKPGIFVVSLSGNGADVASLAVRKQLAALATPLGATEFAHAQNAFIYHLESNLQTPADFAASIGWYATEGRPGYAPGADGDAGSYFDEAEALTPQAVAAAARKFLASRPVTVTLQPAAQEKSH